MQYLFALYYYLSQNNKTICIRLSFIKFAVISDVRRTIKKGLISTTDMSILFGISNNFDRLSVVQYHFMNKLLSLHVACQHLGIAEKR